MKKFYQIKTKVIVKYLLTYFNVKQTDFQSIKSFLSYKKCIKKGKKTDFRRNCIIPKPMKIINSKFYMTI